MNRYPTDEELNRLIEELEQQNLYAPKHLKQQILQQVLTQQNKQQVQADREVFWPKKGSAYKSVQMFTYSFKVVAGMAAAILMLVLLPVQDSQAAVSERIALREQRQIEDLKDWEEESREREERNAFLEESRDAIQKKVEDVLNTWNIFGKIETEEN